MEPSMRVATPVLAVILLALLDPSSASVEVQGRLCGRRLADTLAWVCQGRGFHTGVAKKGGTFLTKKDANNFLRTASLLKRVSVGGSSNEDGIVEKCCRRSCSFDTLESYCAVSRDPNTHPRPVIVKVGSKEMVADRPVPSADASRLQKVRTNQIKTPGKLVPESRESNMISEEFDLSSFQGKPADEPLQHPKGLIGSFTYSRERPFRYLWASGFLDDRVEELADDHASAE